MSLVEEVGWEDNVGVDADEAVAFPIEGDEGLDTGASGHGGWSTRT